MNIGKRLRQIRKEKGITQGELAYLMGYKSKSTISKIEKEINKPNIETVEKLAKALDVKVMDLVDYLTEDETPEEPVKPVKGSPQWYQEEIITMVKEVYCVDKLNMYRTMLRHDTNRLCRH